MSLAQWLQNSWLVEYHPTRNELANFLNLAKRDLRDAENPSLSTDWRFNIAYNAALQSAKAALAAGGYRTAASSDLSQAAQLHGV